MEDGRLAQSWKPCIRPCGSPCGISWWRIPLPAVIHCTSPAPRAPLLPRLSPWFTVPARSEEHTSELQSRLHLVCRLLLEKKKKIAYHLPGETPTSRML